MSKYIYVFGVLSAAILLVAVVFIAINYMPPPSLITAPQESGTYTALVRVMDPSVLPYGTRSLVIGYSGLEIHKSGFPSDSGFVGINASGAFDVMSLPGNALTIGALQANQTAAFDSIRFNVTNAVLRIGNATYGLAIPNRSISVELDGSLQKGAATAVIELTPTVMQTYGAQQASQLYIVFSPKGSIIEGSVGTFASLGGRNSLPNATISKLMLSGPQISINRAAIARSGNSTGISIDLSNTGSVPVTLKQVVVSGFMLLSSEGTALSVQQEPKLLKGVPYQRPALSINAGALLGNLSSLLKYVNLGNFEAQLKKQNISISGLNLSGLNDSQISSALGLNSQTVALLKQILPSALNSSVLGDIGSLNVSESSVKETLNQANLFSKSHYNMLDFALDANGTMSLPSNGIEAENLYAGISLAPGQSMSIGIDRVIRLGDGVALAIPNQTYSITVIGQGGAYASANVTAG